MPWTQLTVSFLVMLGTAMQAVLAVLELARADDRALDWWAAESELIRETPRAERKAAQRELRAMRPIETQERILLIKVALVSWILLGMAGTVAFVAAILELTS